MELFRVMSENTFMQYIKKILLLSVILSLPNQSFAQTDAVDSYLMRQMQKNHIPAISVAIVRNGKIIKLKSYGVANIELDVAATPDSAFQVASTTKPFTGVLLMRLVEHGKLSLDDPITKYISEAPEAWRQITVRHLATHSSGLSDAYPTEKVKTADEAIQAAAKLPLAYTPGSRSAYGLTDFVMLARIMEKMSGQSFPVLLAEQIASPLGLTSTRFSNAVENGPVRISDLVPHRVPTYRWNGATQQVTEYLYPQWTYAAGGLFSSAADLARFVVAIDEGKVLKPASLDAMWERPQLADRGEGDFAIGWTARTYRGRKTVGHSGGPALSDVIRFIDDKLTIVVLTNQQKLFPVLAEGVADVIAPAPVPDRKAIPDDDPMLTELLRRVIVDMGNGKVNDELFTNDARKQLVPGLREFGPQLIAIYDPLKSFMLVEQKRESNRTTRKYRAMYGTKPVLWTFVLADDRRIISMEPVSE
jgi:CubicO group peptidase (beta-lactamase class C family)